MLKRIQYCRWTNGYISNTKCVYGYWKLCGNWRVSTSARTSDELSKGHNCYILYMPKRVTYNGSVHRTAYKYWLINNSLLIMFWYVYRRVCLPRDESVQVLVWSLLCYSLVRPFAIVISRASAHSPPGSRARPLAVKLILSRVRINFQCLTSPGWSRRTLPLLQLQTGAQSRT